jgi:hypothetical protein
VNSTASAHYRSEATLDSNDPEKCLSVSEFMSAVKHRPISNTEDSENQEDRTVLINKIRHGMGDLGSLLDPEILYDKWVDCEFVAPQLSYLCYLFTAFTRDTNTQSHTAGSKSRSETVLPNNESDYEADKE